MGITRVVLADDHAVVRAGLRTALAALPDCEVVSEAATGPQLLAVLAQHHPDLLVVDVAMPDFDPIATIRQIHADYPAMKILVVSAYDDQSYVVGLLAAGVNGYHLKDQPLSDLQLAVQRIMAGGNWISSPLLSRLIQAAPQIAHSSPITLTKRQRDLLRLIAQGYDNRRMAQEMDLSIKTIENHLTALYRTIRVSSRLEAYQFALRHPELLAESGHEAALSREPSTSPAPLMVMIIDDNERYRAQLKRMIGKACAESQIYEAEDCHEATRLLRQITPDLVFVDVILQDGDGIQCLRRLKSVSPHTRVILISAYPDREFRRLGLEAGALAFLDKKDLDAATVRQVVEDTLRRK
ncbi:response regulator transcription factor [Chloroflexus aggregans]|uniref:Two component transcriptional regulator, LuxR family n=1 Tax=Chloroflexus aggregans (strain MD-66 / DSM 9485) TaxID=326427 RepID=B8G446_CHLAD|nr:response regulator transcription factor [Chloroflexus aggregans]ACL25448.1 two component transcriptional regulator, LuxR family [Chloroflexus aggregans DSM 9485]